jgi:hypothetical protein
MLITKEYVSDRMKDAIKEIAMHNDKYRNDPEYSKKGIKNDMWHYACVPNIIIERWMLEHGVNLFDKNHEAAVWRLINSPEYRRFKLTEKIHF